MKEATSNSGSVSSDQGADENMKTENDPGRAVSESSLEGDLASLGDSGESQDSGYADLDELLEAHKENGGLPHSVSLQVAYDSGHYPYKQKISTKKYEQQKLELQAELLKVQSWVRESGARIVGLFEGRDAAERGARSRVSWSISTRVQPMSSRSRSLQRGKWGSGIFNATLRNCQPKGRWCFLTAPGTIAPEWSG